MERCTPASQSALSSSPDVVDTLLDESKRKGWIAKVREGIATLKALVQPPGPAPRLVVDSSISGVTENTTLPNCSLQPHSALPARGYLAGRRVCSALRRLTADR